MKKRKFNRECDACGKGMDEGFYIGEFLLPEYYCSEKCLHTKHTKKEYLELHDGGEGESFWTTWYEE